MENNVGVKTMAKTKERKKKKKVSIDSISFKEKWLAIMREVKELPVTGHHKEGEYWYDKASDVFPIFNDLFAKYRLLPPRLINVRKQIVAFGGYPAYEVICQYIIEDVDSYQTREITGVGTGFNYEWSLDSCMTWALKRALKDAFLAACPQPFTDTDTTEDKFAIPQGIKHYQELAQASKREEIASIITPGKAVEQLDNHFKGNTQKSAKPPVKPPIKILVKPPVEYTDQPAIEGMTRPGKNQLDRIKAAHEFYKNICNLTTPPTPYCSQAVRNALWTYCNMAWPKDDAQVEEFTLNIPYADMFNK